MHHQFQIIVNQMIIFAVLLAIGAIAAKAKVLTGTVLDALAKIVVNITLPAMILTLVPSGANREILVQMLPFLLCSFALILFLFSIGKLTAKIGGLKGGTADVHTAETTFGNVGFMGIPLLLALFGEKGILYISVFSVADHSLLWTLGSYLSSPQKKADFRNNIKKIINPTTGALAIALVIILLGIKMNGVMVDTLKGLGDTTKYLSMVYIGGTLASIDFRNTWKKPTIFLTILSKMIAAPVIVFLLLSLTGKFFEHEAIMTLTIIAALPSMVTIAMLVRANGSDYAYASECVFGTTILSMFTIPLVMWILNWLY